MSDYILDVVVPTSQFEGAVLTFIVNRIETIYNRLHSGETMVSPDDLVTRLEALIYRDPWREWIVRYPNHRAYDSKAIDHREPYPLEAIVQYNIRRQKTTTYTIDKTVEPIPVLIRVVQDLRHRILFEIDDKFGPTVPFDEGTVLATFGELTGEWEITAVQHRREDHDYLSCANLGERELTTIRIRSGRMKEYVR